MIPALLPAAAVIIGVLAVVLFFFVRWYAIATPEMALVISKEGAEPRVLLRGGMLVPSGSIEKLDMGQRDLVIDVGDRSLEIRMTPNETEAAVLSIVRSIGVATANDSEALQRHLRPAVLESASGAFDAARVQRAAEAAVPGFHVTEVTLVNPPARND